MSSLNAPKSSPEAGAQQPEPHVAHPEAQAAPPPRAAPTGIGAVPERVEAIERLTLHAPVFISDLHLCAQRPRSLERFHALLENGLGEAAELVILGDLFEYWAGDDALGVASGADGTERVDRAGGPADAIGAAVAGTLARAAARGIRVCLMRGNRDVLLGEDFLRASGARLLADPVVATFAPPGQPPVLLAHGDAYCTLDLPYQAFRRQAHDAQFQAAFLARPLEQRRALIGEARGQSEAAKQQMAAQIMDVTPDAIDAAMRLAGVRHMVHGHTHRPARHDTTLDGQAAVRWVLPDWDLDASPARGGGLRWDGEKLEFFGLD
jgi:UDP-2,3-diacylglucosamine hydrolase